MNSNHAYFPSTAPWTWKVLNMYLLPCVYEQKNQALIYLTTILLNISGNSRKEAKKQMQTKTNKQKTAWNTNKKKIFDRKKNYSDR